MSYIRGKYAKAACSLIDHLQAQGVAAQVGYASKGRPLKLVALVNAADAEKVPTTWQELPVVVGDWTKVKAAIQPILSGEQPK